MLAYFLAIAVGLGSFVLFMAAFFFPEVYRKGDFIWSGVGFFYALVLWFCAGRFTGAILLGQGASVALIGWLGWQTLRLRRDVTPQGQQTPTEAIAEKGTKGWFKGKTTPEPAAEIPNEVARETADTTTDTDPSQESLATASTRTATSVDESKAQEVTTADSQAGVQTEASTGLAEDTPGTTPQSTDAGGSSQEETEIAPEPSESDQEPSIDEPAATKKPKFWQTGIFAKVAGLLGRKPKTTVPPVSPSASDRTAEDSSPEVTDEAEMLQEDDSPVETSLPDSSTEDDEIKDDEMSEPPVSDGETPQATDSEDSNAVDSPELETSGPNGSEPEVNQELDTDDTPSEPNEESIDEDLSELAPNSLDEMSDDTSGSEDEDKPAKSDSSEG